MHDPKYEGWEGFSQEELSQNPDYINELRFGGDPSSDQAIKDRIYEMDPDELDEWMDRGEGE